MNERDSLNATELLSRYSSGQRSFVGIEMHLPPYQDLSGADLEEADFSGSCLTCIFRGAKLRGTKFCHANVKGSDFSDADLSGADFTGAALDGVIFSGATVHGAKFVGAIFQGTEVTEEEASSHWLRPMS